jgi:hypothetical protein
MSGSRQKSHERLFVARVEAPHLHIGVQEPNCELLSRLSPDGLRPADTGDLLGTFLALLRMLDGRVAQLVLGSSTAGRGPPDCSSNLDFKSAAFAARAADT